MKDFRVTGVNTHRPSFMSRASFTLLDIEENVRHSELSKSPGSALIFMPPLIDCFRQKSLQKLVLITSNLQKKAKRSPLQ